MVQSSFAQWQGLRIFWSSATFATRALFSWLNPAMWLTQLLVLPLFQMAFFVYIARYINPVGVDAVYIAVGNALQVVSFSAIFAVSNITSEEKWQGTLIPLLATPANRFPLFLGRAMIQVLNGMLTIVMGFAYATYIFEVDLSRTNVLALAVVIAVTSFTMTGFGLMIGSVGLYLRTAMIIANIFLFIGLLLCGVNFPVSALPAWLQPASYAIPLTYGTSAARLAVAGATSMEIAPLVIEEILVGAAAIMAGYALFISFEYLARARGTLEEG